MHRHPAGGAETSLTPRHPPEGASNPADAGGALVGSAGLMMIGSAVGAVFSLGNELLAARFLGVASYGIYALAMMLAKSSEMIAAFGVPVSVMHYLPVYLSRGQRAQALGTIIGAIPGPLAVGIAFGLVLWLGGDWVAAHVLGQPRAGRFLGVLAFAVPLLVLLDILGHLARAFGKTLPFIVIERVAPQLCMMVVLGSLLLWQAPEIGIAYGQLFGVGAGVVVGALFVFQMSLAQIGPTRPVLQLGKLYGYAVPIIVNTIVSLAIAWTDLFLLGLLTDASTVGIYRGCMQIVLAFDMVWNAFAAASAPLFAVLTAEGQRARLQQTYGTSIRLATLVVSPVLLIIMVNGSDLLGLLGPRFSEGALALFILACGQCVRVAFNAAFVVLIIGGRQRLDAANVALAAVLNLALNLMLIPVFGLVGAALSTATSLIGLAALRCLELRRVMGLRALDQTHVRVLLVTLPLGLAIWAASVPLGLGPGSGIPHLVLRLAVMGALIGGGLWLFCLDTSDRAMLLRLVLRRGAATAPAGE
jgi:O-antigen/teichoic acid export membrane protein